MFTRIISGLAFCLMAFASFAQYGDLGLNTQPEDSTPIDDLIFYGEFLDMSGGYAIGDTVMNFTVYDFEGNAFNLYEALEGDKPVVLVSGSVSCLRFRDTFEIGNNSQEYLAARNFMENNDDLFNWVFIYGVEAHPTEGECPSNCPTTTSTDTTVYQHPDYFYRRWAVETWTQSEEHNFQYNMYADNPDNAVYNTFFQRPYGMVAMNCDGTVALRADWMNSYMLDENNRNDLLELSDSWTGCGVDWEPEDDGNGGGDDPVIDIDSNDLYGDSADDSVVSVEEESVRFLVYPNPANDRINLQYESTGELMYFLRNITGAIVSSDRLTGSNNIIDVSALADGVYFMEVANENAVLSRQRLVIRH